MANVTVSDTTAANVTVSENKITVTTVAEQGPRGIQGPSGSNSGITVAASSPASPNEGDQWLNSTNQELSIYTNTVWEITTYKSELADDTGSLTLNAGYF